MKLMRLMNSREEDEEVLVRYLLGELDERQRTRLELKLLADDDLCGRLSVAEDDLIDAYVRNELPDKRHRKFRRRIDASPELRSRVVAARALRPAFAARERPPKRRHEKGLLLARAARWALPAAAILGVLIVGLFLSRPERSTDNPDGRRLAIASVQLLPLDRASEVPRVELTAEVGTVELLAYVEDVSRYPDLEGRLESQGRRIWSSGDDWGAESTRGGSTWVLTLPAGRLPTGRLRLELMEGADRPIDAYAFEVMRPRALDGP